MSEDELQPLGPEEAKRMYLNQRSSEVSESTLQAHDYRLGHFLRWCDEENIENLNTLTGRDLHRYKLWRREDGNLNNVTMVTQLSTLKVFLRWCEQIDAVSEGLNEKILLPSVSKYEDRRDTMLEFEDTKKLLDYLRKFEFASQTHTIVELLWHTGMRMGAFHGLDLEDYHPDDQSLEVRHRPESGTRLKNKVAGERYIALKGAVCDVLDAYIEHQRYDAKDGYDRNPLVTSRQGRISKGTIRRIVYRATRPCIYADSCPHGREQESCEAMESDKASKCPSSVSPHALRRGAITHFLSKDVPETIVSDRMNVGLDVLEAHYDRRSEKDKAEQRRGYLDNL